MILKSRFQGFIFGNSGYKFLGPDYFSTVLHSRIMISVKLNYHRVRFFSSFHCWHHPYGRTWRGTKKPLDEGERGEWKTWVKAQIQKMKIMASSPISSWQIDGETMETLRHFIFLGSKITAHGDYSHEIKRHLLLGRKAMTNPDSTLKSRDTTLLTKVCIVKAIVFPVVMYGCESWTKKKAERRGIDACEVWCWRRLLGVS